VLRKKIKRITFGSDNNFYKETSIVLLSGKTGKEDKKGIINNLNENPAGS